MDCLRDGSGYPASRLGVSGVKADSPTRGTKGKAQIVQRIRVMSRHSHLFANRIIRHLCNMSARNWGFMLMAIVIGLSACGEKEGEEPVEEKPIKTEEIYWCENTCIFAYDGECDDGGPDAKTDYCGIGTDCFDCGARTIITVKD